MQKWKWTTIQNNKVNFSSNYCIRFVLGNCIDVVFILFFFFRLILVLLGKAWCCLFAFVFLYFILDFVVYFFVCYSNWWTSPEIKLFIYILKKSFDVQHTHQHQEKWDDKEKDQWKMKKSCSYMHSNTTSSNTMTMRWWLITFTNTCFAIKIQESAS